MSVCWTWNGFHCHTVQDKNNVQSSEHEMHSSDYYTMQDKPNDVLLPNMKWILLSYARPEQSLSAKLEILSSVMQDGTRCWKWTGFFWLFYTVGQAELNLSAELRSDFSGCFILQGKPNDVYLLNFKWILLVVIHCGTSWMMSVCWTCHEVDSSVIHRTRTMSKC